MIRLILQILICHYFITQANTCAAEITQCPLEISVNQNILTEPSGWKAFVGPTRHPLVTVQFSDGPPSAQAFLVPSEEKGSHTLVWNFQTPQEEVWVSCAYNNTSVTLSKKLTKPVTSCQVEYDPDFTPPVARTFSCSPVDQNH
jgi:hypothetical protein